MKIAELQKRENYDAELQHTIDSIIQTDQSFYGDDIDESRKIQWFCHPLFSVYVTKQFCTAGLMFLNHLYRYTPNRIKKYIQPLVTDILSQRWIFEKSLKPAFETPAIANPDDIMWMPGNCRFRKFDFSNRSVRVYPKSGLSDVPIHREIYFRSELQLFKTELKRSESPCEFVLPLNKSFDPAKGIKTFEEPLIECIPINRIPGYSNNKQYIDRIETILHQLHQVRYNTELTEYMDNSPISAHDYIKLSQNLYNHYSKQLLSKFPGISLKNVDKRLSKAFDTISSEKKIDRGWTHGDFQPGNILVSTNQRNDIFIADWEDVGARACIYDAMTYNLESRTRPGVYQRLEQFVSHPSQFPLHINYEPHIAAAIWEIEEWIWLMESSSRDGIVQIPLGLCRRFREIAE